jgi:hypothetical protein
VSVNFCHAVTSLLDFLTLETGMDKLSRNVGAAGQPVRRADNLTTFMCLLS